MAKEKSIFIIFFILFLLGNIIASKDVNAQSVEDRVKQIRSMYATVNDLHKAGAGYDCKKGSTRNKAEVEYSNEIYTQRANRCYYPNGYSKLSLNFEGWEWGADGEYYYKDGRLFFVYVVRHSVCGTRTYRIYYNNAGDIIRVLQQLKDCTDEVQGKNIEVYSKTDIADITSAVNKDLRRAQSMIY